MLFSSSGFTFSALRNAKSARSCSAVIATRIFGVAISLNDLLTRRIVFCRGKTHRGAVGQLHHILHGTFPKRGFADEDGTMQILERAGDDLRAARAAFVDQEGHRKIRTLFFHAGSRVIMLLRSNPALR